MPNQLLEKLQSLDASKKAALDAAGAILSKLDTEKRAAMTTEEETAFNARTQEAEDITKTIEATKKLAAIMPQGNIPNDGGRSSAAAPKVYDNILDKPWGPEARNAETKEERRRRVTIGAGEYLTAVKNAERRGSPIDSRLLALNEDFEKRAAAAGSSEAVPSDGGWLIYPDFATEVLELAHDEAQVYPRTNQLPLSEFTNAIKVPAVDEQSRKDGSRWGGIQAFWENEAQSLTGSKPTFRLLEMVTKKLTGLYYATNEVLADARLLGSLAMKGFGEEFAFKLDDGCIRGTGNGQLSGILNANCLVSVAKETGQATQTVVFENIKKMWGRMWPRSRGNAVWFVNTDVEQQLFGLVQVVGTAGIPVYLRPGTDGGPFGGATGKPYGTIFGQPVIVIEQCSTLGTVGDIILADFSQYLTINKGNLQTAQSAHIRFLTDEMTYRFILRTDGQPQWATSLTPANGTNTLSPFVVCASR